VIKSSEEIHLSVGSSNEREKMKTMKITLLSFIAFVSLGLVGCVSHTHERVVEKDRPAVVIEKETPPPRDTTINVNR
jgi:hypothetical protein